MRAVILAGLLAACSQTWERPDPGDGGIAACLPDPTRQMLASLARGIGFSDIGATVTNDELARLHTLGFTHVRLPFALADVFGADDGTVLSSSGAALVGDMVTRALDARLAVILAARASDAHRARLEQEPSAAMSLRSQWEELGSFLQGKDPKALAFELLDAPRFVDAERWTRVVADVVPALRARLPGRWLIVPANDGAATLPALVPLTDVPQVMYQFGFFEPRAFTQRGEGGWTRDEIERPVREVYAWQLARCLPVRCGGFGARQDASAAPVRRMWLSDVRRYLDKYHLGWTARDRDGALALEPAAFDLLAP